MQFEGPMMNAVAGKRGEHLENQDATRQRQEQKKERLLRLLSEQREALEKES